MSLRRCKFCRCTERCACRLPAVKFAFAPAEPALIREFYILPAGLAIVPPDASTQIVPCSWLLDDVCSNPACVEKAYAEAREWAEQDQGYVELLSIDLLGDLLGEEELEVFP